MSKAVEIFEVGPRDGLQNEPAFIPSEDKIALTQALAGGLELASPRRVFHCWVSRTF